MKKLGALVLALALAAAAAALVVALRGGERGTGRGAAVASAPANAARRAAPAELVPADDRPARREGTEPATRIEMGPLELAATSVAEEDVEPPVAGGVLVEVVRAGSGEAVPHALVRVVESWPPGDAEVARSMAGEPLEETLRRSARVFRADAEGRVRVPPARSRATLTGERGELFGARELERDEPEPVRLALRTEPPLLARVSRAGAPVPGAEVRLLADRGGWSRVLAAATTDEAGLARIERPRALAGAEGASVPIRVAVRALLAVESRVVLDRDALPDGIVELELPPTGAVEVVVETTGIPAPEALFAEVASGRDAGSDWLPAGDTPGAARALVLDGRARFPFVELGLELSAAVFARAHALCDPVSFRGPVRPDEVRTVRLAPDAPPRLAGSLLDPGGRPLVDTEFELIVAISRERVTTSETTQQRTDARGRFLVPAWAIAREAPPSSELSLGFRVPEIPNARARCELDLPLSEDPTDVGDVALELPTLLAAGTVVDARGKPVAGAVVAASRRDEDRQGNERWRPIARSPPADAAGAFEVRTGVVVEESDALGLVAVAPLHTSSERAFVLPGSTGVVLRLPDEGRIAGRLLLHERVPARDLRLAARPAPSGSETEGSAAAGDTRGRTSLPGGRVASGRTVEDDGRFAVPGLAAGSYRLVLSGTREPFEIALADEVEVREGETADLGEIDLRGRLRAIRVRLVSPEGEPLDVQGTVHHRPAGEDESPWTRVVAQSGIADLLALAPAVDLVAHAEGRRVVRVGGVERDRDVVLPGGVEVVVALRDGLPELPEDVTLLVGLVYAPQDDELRVEARAAFDADGAAAVAAPGIGGHALQLELLRRAGPARILYQLPIESAIDVGEDDEGRTHRIHLDEEALRKGLGSL